MKCNIKNREGISIKLPTRKKMDPQTIQRKKFGPTKYPRGTILDPRNTTRKKFGPTQYPREKTLFHEIPTKAWWNDSTRPTTPLTGRNVPVQNHLRFGENRSGSLINVNTFLI